MFLTRILRAARRSDPVVEAVISSARHRPPMVPPDVATPLIFPKHQRSFAIFSYALTGFIIAYGALFVDWGPKEHCFSPLRRHFFGMFQGFGAMQEGDAELIKTRVEEMKVHIEQVESAKKNTLS